MVRIEAGGAANAAQAAGAKVASLSLGTGLIDNPHDGHVVAEVVATELEADIIP